MKIINLENEDYHIHSFNFSDGWNTIDEIVRYSCEIGMKKIAICDHSGAWLKKKNFQRKVYRSPLDRWSNVLNSVDVILGVEADLLNSEGDICDYIDSNIPENFIILSYHHSVFESGAELAANAFIKAIQRHHSKINIIGHVCEGLNEEDAKKVIFEANRFGIPLELNAKYFLRDADKWRVLLDNAQKIYVNSDGHVLKDIRDLRKESFQVLKNRGYI